MLNGKFVGAGKNLGGDKTDEFNLKVLSLPLLPVLVDISQCGLNLLITSTKPGGEVKWNCSSQPLCNEQTSAPNTHLGEVPEVEKEIPQVFKSKFPHCTVWCVEMALDVLWFHWNCGTFQPLYTRLWLFLWQVRWQEWAGVCQECF